MVNDKGQKKVCSGGMIAGGQECQRGRQSVTLSHRRGKAPAADMGGGIKFYFSFFYEEERAAGLSGCTTDDPATNCN